MMLQMTWIILFCLAVPLAWLPLIVLLFVGDGIIHMHQQCSGEGSQVRSTTVGKSVDANVYADWRNLFCTLAHSAWSLVGSLRSVVSLSKGIFVSRRSSRLSRGKEKVCRDGDLLD
jgi:hypothetical protein